MRRRFREPLKKAQARSRAAQKRLKMNPVTRRKGEAIGAFRKRQAVAAKRASLY